MRDVMTVDDVAAYLQVSDRTVYNLVADGQIPAVKIAGKWRFLKTAVDRWLDELCWANVRSPYTNGDSEDA